MRAHFKRIRLGEELRSARMARGIHGEDVAKATGLRRVEYFSVERGERSISLDRLITAARFLGCDPRPFAAAWISAEGRACLSVRDAADTALLADLVTSWAGLSESQVRAIRSALSA